LRSRHREPGLAGKAGLAGNGDRTAYVTAVYEAAIIDGTPAVSDDELTDIAWLALDQLPRLELSRFSRALLSATGYL
jgi:hypothetical protein